MVEYGLKKNKNSAKVNGAHGMNGQNNFGDKNG